MKKKSFFLLIFSSLLLSCEKEIDVIKGDTSSNEFIMPSKKTIVGITSLEDFDLFIEKNKDKELILKLSNESINHIRQSLIFEKGLLISFSYKNIEENNELNQKELFYFVNAMLFGNILGPGNGNDDPSVPSGFNYNAKPQPFGWSYHCTFSYQDICRRTTN